MNDSERDEEQSEARRPRVVDKRISARSSSEGPPAGAADGPASGAAPAPAPPPPQTAPPPDPSAAAPPEPGPQPPAGQPPVWTPEQEAEAQQMAREIAATPSIEWVVNTAATLANVAATKLELGHAGDAGLAIDALAGIVNSVGAQLGQVEAPLRQTLAQLQFAFAERAGGPGAAPGSDAAPL